MGATAPGVTADVVDPTGTVDTLILDLLEWIGPGSRPYSEVIEAWRTSCPRLPVWEEANERGFIARRREPAIGELLSVSKAGSAFLSAHGRHLSA